MTYTHKITFVNSAADTMPNDGDSTFQYDKMNDSNAHIEVSERSHIAPTYVFLINYFLDLTLILLFAAILYTMMRPRVTAVAMGSSSSNWYKALPIMGLSLCMSILFMGTTLGAIISRHTFKRNITVDWYSVLGGNLLLVLILNVPILNIVIPIMLFATTFMAIVRSYIITE